MKLTNFFRASFISSITVYTIYFSFSNENFSHAISSLFISYVLLVNVHCVHYIN